MLMTKKFAGAGETRLDFIHHQQCLVGRAEFAEPFKEASWRYDNAAFALDGLDKHPGDVITLGITLGEGGI